MGIIPYFLFFPLLWARGKWEYFLSSGPVRLFGFPSFYLDAVCFFLFPLAAHCSWSIPSLAAGTPLSYGVLRHCFSLILYSPRLCLTTMNIRSSLFFNVGDLSPFLSSRLGGAEFGPAGGKRFGPISDIIAFCLRTSPPCFFVWINNHTELQSFPVGAGSFFFQAGPSGP